MGKSKQLGNQRHSCDRGDARSNCLRQQGSLISPFPVPPFRGEAGAGHMR